MTKLTKYDVHGFGDIITRVTNGHQMPSQHMAETQSRLGLAVCVGLDVVLEQSRHALTTAHQLV